MSLGSFYRAYHTKHSKYGFSHHLTMRGKFFRTEIGQGSQVLDLGSRDGVLTKEYSDYNHVVAVEIDPLAAVKCRDRVGQLVFLGDLNKSLPFRDNSFDVVVLADVLEHIWMNHILLNEIRRVLRPGGRFLGATPNALYWQNRIKFLQGLDPAQFMDPTHVRHFSLRSLEALLREFFPGAKVVPYGKNRLLRIRPQMFASDFFWIARKEV